MNKSKRIKTQNRNKNQQNCKKIKKITGEKEIKIGKRKMKFM